MKIDSYKPVHQKPPSDVDQQLRDAAKMYEKHFLNEMVKAMRSTVSHTNQPSMAENIYSSQLDQQYVDKWGEKGGIGLSNIIYGQLKERFFPDKNQMMKPLGPLPLEKGGVQIKVDETKPMGIPVIKSGGNEETKDLSYLFELNEGPANQAQKEVTTPWDAEVSQMIRQDDRQLMRLTHSNGLTSTISFIGSAAELNRGDSLKAGDKIGFLGAEARGLTWKIENEV